MIAIIQNRPQQTWMETMREGEFLLCERPLVWVGCSVTSGTRVSRHTRSVLPRTDLALFEAASSQPVGLGGAR